MKSKLCSKCKKIKPTSEFNRSSTSKDGYRWQCKLCHQSYGKNPENRRKWSETYYRKMKTQSPELFLWRQAKHRAKFDYDNMEFSIEIGDIIIPKHCPYLGVELSTITKWTSPSLDRIDSSKGYIKGNIQVISTKANTMKSNATTKELIEFAKGVLACHTKEG